MAQPKLVLVTGPESTGKTSLCSALAERLSAQWTPEYARGYIESLNDDYTYDDVVHIAKKQIQQIHEVKQSDGTLHVFDTGLIITKVWFDIKFGSCPDFLITAIQSLKVDRVLLCAPDLPWIDDPVRENGGEMRQKLFVRYEHELRKCGLDYAVVSGTGEQRISSALQGLKGILT